MTYVRMVVLSLVVAMSLAVGQTARAELCDLCQTATNSQESNDSTIQFLKFYVGWYEGTIAWLYDQNSKLLEDGNATDAQRAQVRTNLRQIANLTSAKAEDEIEILRLTSDNMSYDLHLATCTTVGCD